MPHSTRASRWLATASTALALTAFAASAASTAAQTPRAPFERSFSGAINNLGVISSGVAWADYDGDGDLDLFVSAFENDHNILFQNTGGRVFRRVDAPPLTADAGNSSGAAWGDFDNDGLPDLAVANQAGQDNFLYHNLGGGRFARMLGAPVAQDRGDSYAVSWADYDADGLLDLFVTNMGGPRDFLYRNLGGGKFERVESGVFATRRGASFSSTWGDYDSDGRLDLFVADAGRATPNRLYHNLGGGRFELDTSGAIGVDVAQSKGAAWGDFDNDGDLDLLVVNGGFTDDERQAPFFYRNDAGKLVRITQGPIATDAFTGVAPVWLDYDNDGDLDLLVTAYREHNRLYRNEGGGAFTRIVAGFLVSYGGYNDAAAVADYDRDGSLDVMISHWEHQNAWLLTNARTANHFVSLRLVGTRSNRDAIGARVWVTATIGGRAVTQLRQVGSETGGRGQSAHDVHVGLGDATHVTKVRIAWPSGGETLLDDVVADHFVTVEESRGIVAAAARDSMSTIGDDAVGLLFGAARRGGIDSVRAVVARLRAQYPAEPWADHLSFAGDMIAVFSSPADGRAMLELAMADGTPTAAVLFRAAEVSRSAKDAVRAASLYCRALEVLRTQPASPSDARDREYMRLTAARYVDARSCHVRSVR